MTQLILKRAPIGDNQDDYDVLENGVIVGRIFKVPVAPQGRPWIWASGHNGDHRRAAHGTATSRRGRLRWRRSQRAGGASNALGDLAVAHQAVAIALHIELTDVAFPVCGFGLLPADQLATHLFYRGPRLRGKGRSRQRNERKHQQNRPHLTLQASALAGARLWAHIIPTAVGRM
jgi:hypothetical protein